MIKRSLYYIQLMVMTFHLLVVSVVAEYKDFSDIAEDSVKAIVSIEAKGGSKKEESQPQQPRQNAPTNPNNPFEDFFKFFDEQQPRSNQPKMSFKSGTGFVIDEEGLIVTNNHVVSDSDTITVKFSDGKSYKAKLIGQDEKTDLAVLKINTGKKLPFLKFGDSDKLRLAEPVMAIGNPFGLTATVSLGVVSAVNRREANIMGSGSFADFLQIDAAVNQGNSGGPLFNSKGEVVGVNSAIFSLTGGWQGIGFSIKSNKVVEIVNVLKTGKSVERASIGVTIEQLSSNTAESLGLDPDNKYVSVVDFNPKSEAKKAGLREGDIILEFEGVAVKDADSLRFMVAAHSIDKPVTVKIWRTGGKNNNGKPEIKTVKFKLINSKDLEQEKAPTTKQEPKIEPNKKFLIPNFGIVFDDIDEQVILFYGLDNSVKGAMVYDVDANSNAYFSGIQKGDIITHVNGVSINSATEMYKLVSEEKNKKKSGVTLTTLLRRSEGNAQKTILRHVFVEFSE